MLAVWAEQAQKYRSGEISKEQYDEWRYTYPEKSHHTAMDESAVTGAQQYFGRTIQRPAQNRRLKAGVVWLQVKII